MPNLITEPGKFEGEHISVPHFWNGVLEGGAEDVYVDETPYSFIRIDDEDRALFPDLTEYGVQLHQSDQGFVYAVWFDTEEKYLNALEAAQSASEEEYED